jgi:hypothetical protein
MAEQYRIPPRRIVGGKRACNATVQARGEFVLQFTGMKIATVSLLVDSNSH